MGVASQKPEQHLQAQLLHSLLSSSVKSLLILCLSPHHIPESSIHQTHLKLFAVEQNSSLKGLFANIILLSFKSHILYSNAVWNSWFWSGVSINGPNSNCLCAQRGFQLTCESDTLSSFIWDRSYYSWSASSYDSSTAVGLAFMTLHIEQHTAQGRWQRKHLYLSWSFHFSSWISEFCISHLQMRCARACRILDSWESGFGTQSPFVSADPRESMTPPTSLIFQQFWNYDFPTTCFGSKYTYSIIYDFDI